MSKMSELSTVLDEMSAIGARLIECGEGLKNAAACVLSCLMKEDETEQAAPEKPAQVTYTKEDIRAMLAGLAQAGFREEARALVRKYANGGSLADVDPARYPELAEEAQKYHA